MKLRDIKTFLFGTLRGRLILGVAFVHAVMMTLFIVDLTIRQRKILRNRQIEETTEMAKSLSTSAAVWIASDDISGLQELIQSIQRYPHLQFAMLMDESGFILAHTDSTKQGLYFQNLPKQIQKSALIETKESVMVIVPAQLGRQHIGWVCVAISSKSSREKMTEMVLMGILYAFIAILIGSLIAWWIGNLFTRRIYAIQHTMNEVKSGNWMVRSNITGTDEAASMACEFNTLLDTLDEQRISLTKSEGRLNEAQHIAHIGSWELDINNDILTWSDEIFRIFEIDPTKFGASYEAFLDAIHPDDRDAVNDAYTNSLKTRIPYTIDHRLLFKDGRIKYIHEQCETFYDVDGKPFRSLGIVQDITERKQTERKILKLNQELEKRVLERTAQLGAANKELEAFAYSVSHDLRAPLRGIDGFSQVLLEDYQDKIDEKGKNYLHRIRLGAQRMAQLIDDMLNLSRVNRGELNIQQVDLSAIAETVAEELRQTQPDRNVEFIIQKGIQAKGDDRLLRIVFNNLLENAWKFTSKHPNTRIEFGLLEEKETAVYFVRDDGAGFDMKYSDKLFGAFQRLHNTTEFPGTGVGLATVQRVIHRHGGKVWAESKVEKGAIIYFTIP